MQSAPTERPIRVDPSAAPPPPPEIEPDSPQSQFLAEAEAVRFPLHRFCSRMLGSSLDGEDVVQDTLAAAFLRLDSWDRSRPLAPLLYRIAHNRCIDRLRRRRFEVAGERFEVSTESDPERQLVLDQLAAGALEGLVLELTPRERSCFLLKEVLEMSLVEVAEVVGCSEGAVKSALHRGRERLEAIRERGGSLCVRSVADDPETAAVLARYVARFNARDWTGLAALLAEDIRLDVVGVLEDGTREVILDRYVGNYSALEGEWRLSLGRVDGELVVLCLRRLDDMSDEVVAWVVRPFVDDGLVVQLRDYVLQDALAFGSVTVGR